MIIEISYAIIFAVIAIILALTVTRKMSMGIGIMGIAAGFGIAYFIAPYAEIVISPVGDALIYGGIWALPAIMGLIHLITLIIMAIVAFFNLMKSGGKITWA